MELVGDTTIVGLTLRRNCCTRSRPMLAQRKPQPHQRSVRQLVGRRVAVERGQKVVSWDVAAFAPTT